MEITMGRPGPVPKKIEWIENANGCWVCTSHWKDKDGYPKKRYGRNVLYSMSRWIWMQCFGKIPTGMSVCHTCDTPACIRIDHLYLGTTADNMRDKALRNRVAGERNPHHKLTWKLVRAIRSDNRSGIIIAFDYRVTPATISKIKLNQTWKEQK